MHLKTGSTEADLAHNIRLLQKAGRTRAQAFCIAKGMQEAAIMERDAMKAAKKTEAKARLKRQRDAEERVAAISHERITEVGE